MELAARLREEAVRADERRLLVLAGEPGATHERAEAALDAAGIARGDTAVVSRTAPGPGEQVDPDRANTLLGATRTAIVLDCHEACRPNVIGQTVGAVDGGGLYVVRTPPLGDWPDRRDGFDETLAVHPYDVGDVGGRFRRRLVATLRAHRGVAIVDAADGSVLAEGLTDPAPRRPRSPPTPPTDPAFRAAAYEACLTADQARAVESLGGLQSPGTAVVLEADRGRGKSSAAGIAAAMLALEGRDVVVTGPQYRATAAVFQRGRALLTDLGELAGGDRGADPRVVETETGRIRYIPPDTAAADPDSGDVLIVDESAALPVRRLSRFLEAESVAFATTIHGYEGAGRGFSVRFRDHLAASSQDVVEVTLSEPIRYAAGDPVEVWAFRALCLNASPVPDALVAEADPSSVRYDAPALDDLAETDHRLRSLFGLLVLAHYRTEPNDLARLLDAPNVSVRTLTHRDRVVAVALLAREGGLPSDLRSRLYEGERIRGHMLPDVLTSQLRDERAGEPEGQRILRIATHPAVRSRGLGSRLLAEIRSEFGDAVDWLGVGYGATPALLRFWRQNGFRAVHCGTSRNDASGEYSAIMLDPCSPAGADLGRRHSRWFARRVAAALSDPLADLDPDVVRHLLAAVDDPPEPGLSDWEWRHLVGMATGTALFDTAPRGARRLAATHLMSDDSVSLEESAERLLVRKVLQGRPWGRTTEALGYPSRAECMRALGRTIDRLLDRYAPASLAAERDRLA